MKQKYFSFILTLLMPAASLVSIYIFASLLNPAVGAVVWLGPACPKFITETVFLLQN